MMTADLALAILINRTAEFFQANPPIYMTYTERTHISAPSLGRSEDVNRSVAVRVADNFAVMQDLPQGAQRTGQAFPFPAYFDPFSSFSYSYYASPKRVDVTVHQGQLEFFPTPPPDPGVNVVVAYNSYWAARYAPDSTDTALHLLVEPTPRVQGLYPSEIVEDAGSHLPSHVEMRATGGDNEVISFDYKVIGGYWVLTHAAFAASQHALGVSFKTNTDVTFNDIAFPPEPPDPRLAGTPMPTSSP
ncbi:MAG TPA: hypothetical protein VFF63_04720 [Candidatus Babeliales bacterium]|nr:hypothetical protein [Candidatus Babeliales bacterium]